MHFAITLSVHVSLVGLSRIIEYLSCVCVCSCALFGILEAASIPTAVRLGYAGIRRC